MEEAGWRGEGNDGEGDGDNGGGGPHRPQGSPVKFNRSIWIIGLLFILLLSFNWVVNVYTDWLWFTELSYDEVWLKQWAVRLTVFVVAIVIAAAVLLGNWLIARRLAIRNTSPFHPQFLTPSGVGWLIAGVAIFLAFTFASGAASQWEELLLFLNRIPFAIDDPIFNRDVGFYIFELPVYEFLQGWLLSLTFLALLGILPIYAINQLPDIQRGRWRPQESVDLRRHVALLAGLFLALWSIGYLFDIFGLLYSPRGVVFGASYTDMNASLWALRAQFLFMALTSLAVFYNIFRFSFRPVLITGGLWLAATFLLGGLYPGLLQRYAVEPNEMERERPFIDHNINFTRQAFDLDSIEVRPWDSVTDLSEQDLELNEDVVRNVRLWDYRPLQRTYEQLQALRPYYQFSLIDIDRYEGYGIVMNPVDSITSDGQPEFFIQDLPPQSNIDLEVERPEIYYGELTTDAVFVSSGREEFSYPSGSENVYTSYEGDGGVPLDSFLKRVAFAIRLGDANVLLSDEIDSGTRVQFHRSIQMIPSFRRTIRRCLVYSNPSANFRRN
jgi:uncharacterized membrane protein (UPF0182 family)